MLVCLSSSPIIRHKFRLFISDFLISFITARLAIRALGLSAAVADAESVPARFRLWLWLILEVQVQNKKPGVIPGFLLRVNS